MDISEEEANQKIKSIFYDKMLIEFNNSLQKFYDIYDDSFNMVITEDSKISEIINVNQEGNKIFKIYSWIIKEYNNFFETLNIYEENKKYIKEVIIQNCIEKDYISFKLPNNKSIQERLKEIIQLYSKRNRINENKEINVYDGGRIRYNFELIENMLEEEFIMCKRRFSEKQKFFIFSNNIFSGEKNKILVDFYNKYFQEEILDSAINNSIIAYLNKNEGFIKQIYYNCLYLILYLMIYLKDEKIISPKTDIDYLIKLMEKENNKIDEKFKNLFNSIKLNISQLFSLYEKIEEKAFDALVEKIKQETKKFESDKINEETENRIKNIINNNSLLNQDLLINGIKKYIVRYFLGDSIRNNPHNLENIKFDDIFNRMDIWGKNIFDDKKFKDESNKLCSLNKKENNNLLMYFYSAIFKKEDKLPTVNEDPNNLSDDEELG